MKYFFSGILGVIICVVFASNSFACSPGPDWPPSAEENYTSSEVVFVGIITDISQENELSNLRLKFKIVKTYKGDIDKEVVVTTASSSSMCGYDPGAFTIGDAWTIYASNSLNTSHLMLNKKFITIKEALQETSDISGIDKCSNGDFPVCGQLPMSKCESDDCAQVMPKMQTYSNKCEMEELGAKFVKNGACEACSEGISPVCGEIDTNIRCIKAPCPSSKRVTFKNKCLANKVNAKNITEGKCEVMMEVPNGNPEVNIKDNQVVKSPLIIKGNSKNVWFGFGGTLGTVELIGGSGTSLGKAGLNVIGEWMTENPVEFESSIEFDANSETEGKLVFRAENPSGEPIKDKSFIIPVRFELETDNDGLETSFFEKIWNFFKNLFR